MQTLQLFSDSMLSVGASEVVKRDVKRTKYFETGKLCVRVDKT